jgi:hypothetical protein
MEAKTFAAWVPTCKVCGSTNMLVTFDHVRGRMGTLPCGHPFDVVLIPNPQLPPPTEAP